MIYRAQAFLFSLALALWVAALCGGQAEAGLVRDDQTRSAVVLVGGGPGGQKQLGALATAFRVGGYEVVSLAPDASTGGLAALTKRIARAVAGLAKPGTIREVSLVAHGAGGLAAVSYLKSGYPAKLKRALFVALPVDGLSLPAKGSPCRDAWRKRVASFYGLKLVKEAAPGSKLQKALRKEGVPLDLLVGSISGKLNQAVADGMLTRAGCAKDLSALPGDGVIASGSLQDLPGFGRDDRDYLASGDHLSLPEQLQVRDLAMRFMKLTGQGGSVAVVLVIDGSGSVRSVDKLGMRVGAVRLLISRLAPGDQVGVVTFNTKANTVMPLEAVSSKKEAARLAAKIKKLPAKGDTDIGAGLARALDLLETARPGSRKIIVLLTDGRNDPESANAPTLDVVKKMAAGKVVLHAMGLTDKVDELFLSGLARMAKGHYLAVKDAGELVAVFDRMQAAMDGRTLLLSSRGKAPASFKVLADSTISRLDISLMGNAPDLGINITGPGGKPEKLRAARGRGYATFTIPRPAAGDWKLAVTGPVGARFRLQVAAATGLVARLAPLKKTPKAGEPWYFSLEVLQDDLPLKKTQAALVIKEANGSEHRLNLKPTPVTSFSSGRSSAGTLSGKLAAFNAPGDASLKALVSGINRLGEPFQRLVRATVHVSDMDEYQKLRKTLKGRSLSWGE